MLYLGASPTEILWKGTKAPVFNRKQLCALLIPLMLEQILASLMGMADTMMVSNVSTGLAAIAIAIPVIRRILIQSREEELPQTFTKEEPQ